MYWSNDSGQIYTWTNGAQISTAILVLLADRVTEAHCTISGTVFHRLIAAARGVSCCNARAWERVTARCVCTWKQTSARPEILIAFKFCHPLCLCCLDTYLNASGLTSFKYVDKRAVHDEEQPEVVTLKQLHVEYTVHTRSTNLTAISGIT